MSELPVNRFAPRSELLQEAERIVTQDRNKTYGEPDEDFRRIAALASAWGFRVDSGAEPPRELTGADVAVFMQCLKLSRLAWMPTHRDSWLDIAGYAACGYETAQLQASREAEATRSTTEYLSTLERKVVLNGPSLPVPLKRSERTRGFLEIAREAVAGNPTELDESGFILMDRHDVDASADKCDEYAQTGNKFHQFDPYCQYMICRRRES